MRSAKHVARGDAVSRRASKRRTALAHSGNNKNPTFEPYFGCTCKQVASTLHPAGEQRIKRLSMYVCNCNALTEKQIREAIAKRPRDAAAVYRYYDCQPQCGRCVCEVREMLRAAREAKAAA
jgi:bacterioferritin-associated ferredoxin